jgi:hypothetical protein
MFDSSTPVTKRELRELVRPQLELGGEARTRGPLLSAAEVNRNLMLALPANGCGMERHMNRIAPRPIFHPDGKCAAMLARLSCAVALNGFGRGFSARA